MDFVFSKETAYNGIWDENNPSQNHCAVVALFLHKKFGYEIYKTRIGKSWHYFNKNCGEIIDETKSQLSNKIDYKSDNRVDEKRLYRSIKSRFELFLQNNNGV